ncbi:MAG: carbonic anhydrase [Methylocystis sp.]
MQRLIEGLHQFQSQVFGSQRELFERLAKGQAPETLFITCADSRIDPCLLTQSAPGDLFILRNAGNLVPAYGAVRGGEAATIEFAIAGLGVKDIIVCGHSHCGAMRGLLDPPPTNMFPALNEWLSHAETTRRIMQDKYADRDGADRLNVAIQENVLAQLENLRTHPVVASAIAQDKLRLHGWVYKIETGQVFVYDPAKRQFGLAPAPTDLITGEKRERVSVDV